MRLLFVCTGNICRSPTAEAVMRHKAEAAGLAARLTIDSAGTEDWNVGLPPSRLAVECARAKGYDMAGLTARQLRIADFHDFDRVFAMDRGHLSALQRLKPEESAAEIALFLLGSEVPDPYSGTRTDYERTLELIETGTEQILSKLTPVLSSAG